MKITKSELKEMINESVERQLRNTEFNQYNNRKKINHQRNNYNKTVNESSNNEYKYFPKSKEELKKIIQQEIRTNGNNCDLNMIDTSKITDMSYMFTNSKFNGDISKWDVSNVKDMESMFKDSKFNRNISKWFNTLNLNCNLKNFGTFRGYNINSYDDFKIYYKQTTLDLL